MERKILSFILLFGLFQIGFSQKYYSITGVVISQISELPVCEANLRITIEGPIKKVAVLNDKAKFKIDSLIKGQYKLTIEIPSEAGDFYYRGFDTTVVLDKEIRTNLKLFRRDSGDCDEWGIHKQKALEDIKKNKPALYLPPTGISGEMDLDTKDFEFEKKYNITYLATGCSFPNFECFRIYNLTIFEYLDKKNGKKWRDKAKKNVLFLKLNN